MIENDSPFIDAESQISFNNETPFSYQNLVMDVMRRCLEAGSHEMRTGWWNVKTDKTGNRISTYIEDTRKKFIESVETAMDFLDRDFDEKAYEKIKEILELLENKHKDLLKKQETWFNSLDEFEKRKVNLSLDEQSASEIFDTRSMHYQTFIEEQVKSYRLILRELMKLIKRNKDYKTMGISE